MKLICNYCGESNVLQSASIMIDPYGDDFDELKDLNNFTLDDYFYCVECNKECTPEEKE